LTIISDALGVAGGGVVSTFLVAGVDWHQYWSTAWQILVFQDVFMGLAKPVLFGFIIATIGCYYGLSARGGTQGVGRATTQAMVASSILIIMVDFFVTRLTMTVFGP
ncbi:MAG: ABC transporter permease, partial [Acidobacteria bacterium]|nr:ABC transporter permease [Acidobacteriota bacterium]